MTNSINRETLGKICKARNKVLSDHPAAVRRSPRQQTLAPSPGAYLISGSFAHIEMANDNHAPPPPSRLMHHATKPNNFTQIIEAGMTERPNQKKVNQGEHAGNTPGQGRQPFQQTMAKFQCMVIPPCIKMSIHSRTLLTK